MAKFELVEAKHPNAAPNRFRDLKDAQQFLKETAAKFENLPGLRAAWKKTREDHSGGSVPPDRVILTDLAKLLVAGRLRTTRDVQTTGGSGGGGSDSDAPRSAPHRPRPEKSAEPPMMIRARPDPSSASAPDPVVNVMQQVMALLEAAKSGTPFCEQCQDSDQ